MSKCLEALNKLVSHIEAEYHSDDYYECKNAKDIIERELKALEIIREKIVDTRILIRSKDFVEYAEKTRQYADCRPLSKGEFIFLKEAMK